MSLTRVLVYQEKNAYWNRYENNWCILQYNINLQYIEKEWKAYEFWRIKIRVLFDIQVKKLLKLQKSILSIIFTNFIYQFLMNSWKARLIRHSL